MWNKISCPKGRMYALFSHVGTLHIYVQQSLRELLLNSKSSDRKPSTCIANNCTTTQCNLSNTSDWVWWRPPTFYLQCQKTIVRHELHQQRQARVQWRHSPIDPQALFRLLTCHQLWQFPTIRDPYPCEKNDWSRPDRQQCLCVLLCKTAPLYELFD